MDAIDYRLAPPVSDDALNRLYAAAWPRHRDMSFATELSHALTCVCAYDGERLVGYVKVAWDGSQHGFLLDTTVDRAYQRRGIGTELVRRAIDEGARRGLEWMHVDYDPHLDGFYPGCGFRHTLAGLVNLAERRAEDAERACVRCGTGGGDAPLVATPEGFLCEACYGEAK